MTDLSLLQDFVTETVEHLEEMEGNLLQLETDPGNRDVLNDIFRSVHTIKGASEYLGMARIAELSHKLENLLDLMRRNTQSASREVIDLLMAARDRIGLLTADLHQTQTEQADIEDLLARIQALDSETLAPLESTPATPDADPDVILSPIKDDVPADVPPNASENEIYEEEHDEELFGIFLEQLQDGLEALQSWTDALSGADRTDRNEILGRCLGQIDPLRSSANYMGYGKLTALYDHWDAAIQTARERLTGGDDHAMPAFIANEMQANIDEIGRAFPRLKIPGASPQDVVPESDPDPRDIATPGQRTGDDEATGTETGAMENPLPTADDRPPGELNLFPDPSDADEDFNLLDERENSLDLTLIQEFITETVEHLAEMESNLLQLETDPENQDILNDIFRSVHTIKGASEYLGMERIAELSHKLENLLDLMRHRAQTASREVIDLLMAARDRIGILTADLHQTQTEQADIADLLVRIQALDSNTLAPKDNGPATPDADPAGITPPIKDDVPADVPLKASENEIYEEEHDEELFGIFLEQLQEGLEALQSWTRALSGADRSDRNKILGRCLEQIDPLRSSANYMGYRQLTALYDRWNEAIRTAQERLTKEDETFMPAFIAGCMQATIDDISRCFPRLERSSGTPQPAGATRDIPDAVTPGPSDLLDAYAESPETTQAQNDDPIAADPGPTAGGDLFDRLSRSFDRKMAEHQAPLSDEAPSGMELELFSEGHPTDFDDLSSAMPDPQTVSAEDPLAAYVVAPETPVPEAPVEDYTADNAPSPPVDISAADRDMTTDIPNDDDAGDSPLVDRQDTTMPAAMPDTAYERIPEVPVEDPVTEVSPDRDTDRTYTASPPDTARVEAPATIPPSHERLSTDIEPHAGDRRDSLQRGRRKSDRISEQLLKQSIRVDAVKIDDLMNQVGELVVSRAWFSQLFHEMRDLQQNLQHRATLEPREMKQVKGLTFRLSEATVALGRVANELQEGVMKVRMLPIAQLFNRYPRLVFDLVRDGDKKVQLDIKGEETELDKMVIEAISDPLIHIIRNAVDHGIETAAERQRLGKPESGTIHLEAYHEGNHVVIQISDDGRGLDIERIKAKAVSGKFATPEELANMSLKELTGLIMQPGFSTKTKVTHTSGRGVGMDVVKQNIEKLNGTLEIDSTPGSDTCFRIKIPLTLAIIPALLVQVRKELFTIPLSTVEETIRIAPDDLSTIEGVEVMQLRETTLPLVRLENLFNMPSKPSDDGRAFVVVVSTGMKRVGLVVDVLLGQEEVVIKPLEDYLQEKSGFSGATILGDGRISLILDIYELVNLSISRQAKRKTAGAPV